MSEKKLYTDAYCKNVHNNFGMKTYSYSLRLKQILKLININSNDKILEIGANTGDLVRDMMKRSLDVVGIDFNAEAVKIANAPNVILMNAEKLDFPDNSFDKIVSVHVIEHIPDVKKALAEAGRVLKPGGEALYIYPLELVRGSNAIFDAIKVYKNPWLARKLHIHKLTPKKMARLVSGTCLTVRKSGVFLGPYPTFYSIFRKN